MNSGERPCIKAILLEKHLWILFLVGVLYSYRPLFLGETYFYRDLYEHSIPQKQLFVDIIKSGEIPLWDPYLHGGQPYLAEINNLPLYPSGLLYLLLPFFTAFNLDITLHIIFCGWATYAFCRVLRFSKNSALFAGIVYQFCGFTLSQVNLLNRLTALPYMPLTLTFWHLFLSEKQKRFLVCSVLSATMQIFAASPETSLLTYLTLLLWSLLYPYGIKSSQKIIRWCLLMIFVAGVSAIQILPTVEMILQSSRPHHDFETFTTWSLHPKRLPELIVPRFFGRTDALAEWDYWGKTVEGVPYAYVLSIYFGLFVIALICTAAFTKDERLPGRIRKYLLVQFVLAGLLCFGRFLPGYRWIYEYVPFIHWFRYPIKFLAGTVLPGALLCGYTIEVYFSEKSKKIDTRYLVSVWSLAVVLICFTASFFFFPNFSKWFQTIFFDTTRENIENGLRSSFFHATAIWLAYVLVCHARSKQPSAWQQSVLIGILFLDLFLSGKPVNPSAPRSFFRNTPPLVQTVKEQLHDGRLFRDEVPSRVVLKAPSNDVIWQNVWYLQVLNYYTGAYYRIPVIFHRDYDDLAQRRIVQLKDAMDRLGWEHRRAILSVAAVRLILTEQIVAQYPLSATVRNASNLTFYLYINAKAVSRIHFVQRALFSNSPSEALKLMLDKSFDPQHAVVLEGTSQRMKNATCDAIKINTVESRINRSKFTVQNGCDGYLVFSEPYYPGWKVSVDGKPVKVLRANYAFSAIELAAGTHRIERSFVPGSVLIGLICSALFLAVLLVTRRIFIDTLLLT